MSLTPSNMLPLGTPAPDFVLPNTVTGEMVSFKDLASPTATVVMFICNHCPYVVHILGKLLQVTKEYKKQGVNFIAISSNDVNNYPDDSPEKMKALALLNSFPFPYLYDESQEVAKAYQAACTPDFYIFDSSLSCAYRGRFDEATPGNGAPITGNDLTAALDKIIAKKQVDTEQTPSMGCNIKWKD